MTPLMIAVKHFSSYLTYAKHPGFVILGNKTSTILLTPGYFSDIAVIKLNKTYDSFGITDEIFHFNMRRQCEHIFYAPICITGRHLIGENFEYRGTLDLQTCIAEIYTIKTDSDGQINI
jgi:hypothetical protein